MSFYNKFLYGRSRGDFYVLRTWNLGQGDLNSCRSLRGTPGGPCLDRCGQAEFCSVSTQQDQHHGVYTDDIKLGANRPTELLEKVPLREGQRREAAVILGRFSSALTRSLLALLASVCVGTREPRRPLTGSSNKLQTSLACPRGVSTGQRETLRLP